MAKLKAALIGAGQIVWNSHIPNYQKLGDLVELVGVCDVNREQAQKTADAFGIPHAYGSKEELFQALSPDMVSVCVPNRFHCESTLYALEQGCHVLCEKPPAMDAPDARKMADTAKALGRLLSFNFHFRHGPDMRMLKNRISRGDFGDIYGARVQSVRRRGIPGWGTFTNKAMQGGGPLIDIGIHMLDLALYMMGFPEAAYVCASTHQRIGTRKGVGLMGQWDPEKFTVEDAAFGFIRFQNGASLSLETAFALNVKEKDIRNVHLFGSQAGASLFPMEVYAENEFTLTNETYPFLPDTDRHQASIENFVRACAGEEPLIVRAEEAVQVQTLIAALYQSAETGRPVSFE